MYSPSQVEAWMLCPMYRHWKSAGWMPKQVGKGDWARWIGTGIHAGLACRYQGSDVDEASQTSLEVYEAERQQAIQWGRSVGDPPKEIAPHKLIKRAVHDYPVKAWTVLQTEYVLPHGRIDLVVENPEITLVDFKTKLKKPSDYLLQRMLVEYRHAWQFVSYVHQYSQVMLKPVRRVWVEILFLDPFETLDIQWTIPNEDLRQFKAEQAVVFQAMDLPPHRNRSRCHNLYGGDCPYLSACWTYNGDEDRMQLEYVRVHGRSQNE